GGPLEQRHALELLVVACVEIMLAGHECVPAAVARVAYHDELLLERAHHVGREPVLIGDENADFHAILLACNKYNRHPEELGAERRASRRMAASTELVSILRDGRAQVRATSSG